MTRESRHTYGTSTRDEKNRKQKRRMAPVGLASTVLYSIKKTTRRYVSYILLLHFFQYFNPRPHRGGGGVNTEAIKRKTSALLSGGRIKTPPGEGAGRYPFSPVFTSAYIMLIYGKHDHYRRPARSGVGDGRGRRGGPGHIIHPSLPTTSHTYCAHITNSNDAFDSTRLDSTTF